MSCQTQCEPGPQDTLKDLRELATRVGEYDAGVIFAAMSDIRTLIARAEKAEREWNEALAVVEEADKLLCRMIDHILDYEKCEDLRAGMRAFRERSRSLKKGDVK
jgi:hypothetical protein